MFRLATTLFSLVGTSFAGTGVIAVLVIGADSVLPIVLAAGAGVLVALPATWLIARAIYTES